MIRTHMLLTLVRQKCVQNFNKKNSMVVGARQSLYFFKEITWFLRNKRALSKSKYWILHHLISIIKLQNNQPEKPNFILTTRATLNILKMKVIHFQNLLRVPGNTLLEKLIFEKSSEETDFAGKVDQVKLQFDNKVPYDN